MKPKKAKLKVSKIIRCIKHDATLVGAYIGSNGVEGSPAMFCVIGGLLHDSGFDMGQVAHVNTSAIWDTDIDNLGERGINALRDMKAHLRKEYGIKDKLAMRLQHINDNTCNLAERRKLLIAAVKKEASKQ